MDSITVGATTEMGLPEEGRAGEEEVAMKPWRGRWATFVRRAATCCLRFGKDESGPTNQTSCWKAELQRRRYDGENGLRLLATS